MFGKRKGGGFEYELWLVCEKRVCARIGGREGDTKEGTRSRYEKEERGGR